MKLKVAGYEKFWLALLAGNSVQVPITLTLLLIAVTTGIPDYMPTAETVIFMVGVFWGSLWAALGAFFGKNTEPAGGGEEEVPTMLTRSPAWIGALAVGLALALAGCAEPQQRCAEAAAIYDESPPSLLNGVLVAAACADAYQ